MAKSGLSILDDCDVSKIVEYQTGEKNLPVISWSLKPFSKINGYMGSYWQLNVTVDRYGVFESFSFFAKTPPPPGPQNDYLFRHGLFNKEIAMYNEIIPRMGIGNGAKWSPNCYLCKPDIIIVLENLALDGYCTLDKYVPFGYEELACLFDTFARFHSKSLILDEQLRQQGNNLLDVWGELLNEGIFCTDEQSLLSQKSSYVGFYALIDLVDGLEENQKTYLKQKAMKWSVNLVNALQPSRKYRNIICHRDVWSSNFMFKSNENGSRIDCRLIDFQFYSYIYPGMDLMLAMYMNSIRKIRDKYFDSLIILYYNHLRKYLKSDANLDIEQIIPWNVLLESCETARPHAMIYALACQQITLLGDEATEEYFAKSPELLHDALYGTGRHKLVSQQFLTIPQYRERIADNIFELYECLPEELPSEDSDD